MIIQSQAMAKELNEYVRQVITSLESREQLTIELRFGLGDKGPRVRTIEEVARELDITRERVRQIEAKALRYFGTLRERKN